METLFVRIHVPVLLCDMAFNFDLDYKWKKANAD